MKKLFILSSFIVFCLLAAAQNAFSLTEGQSVMVYSLPKTELCIEIVTEKVTEKPGIFYRYSERYLATDKVITEEKTSYKLKSIVVKPRAIADSKRTYSFEPAKKTNQSHLSVDEKGILFGINTPYLKDEKKELSVRKSSKTEDAPTSDLLPLGEEYMMAGSEAKLAEGAAKQIYRIRESRLGILTADVEHLPQDGSSFKTVLNGLNKMEKELTELFVGKVTSEIATSTVYFTPESPVSKDVLFRLSAFNGVVSKDDLSGKPYYISVSPAPIPMATTNSKNQKESAALYYVLPASTTININDGVATLYNEVLDVPQLGKVIPISASFIEQPNIKIKFDTKTGRLLTVE